MQGDKAAEEELDKARSALLLPTLRWRGGGVIIPWRHNGTRCAETMFLRLYYACRVECIRWHPEEKAVRVYLEARGQWDLRHPSTSTFRIRHLHDESKTTDAVTGRWVSEVPNPAWGHYKGYLELPESFFENAAGGTLVFSFARVGSMSVDYPPAALLTFPATSWGVLEELFLGISDERTIVGRTPDESPFGEDPEAERAQWGQVFPEDVLDGWQLGKGTSEEAGALEASLL